VIWDTWIGAHFHAAVYVPEHLNQNNPYSEQFGGGTVTVVV
jgi:hypothetical protein